VPAFSPNLARRASIRISIRSMAWPIRPVRFSFAVASFAGKFLHWRDR
jgi:hypothetical protein